MGLLLLLFGLNIVLTLAGLAFLWRRTERMNGEIAHLRRALGARGAQVQRMRAGQVVPIAESDLQEEDTTRDERENPLVRAARAWGLPHENVALPLAEALAPETLRGGVLALMATAPALAFFFNADPSLIVASGLAISAAMMLVALRPLWRTAAWAAVLAGGAWALLGFALGAAHADPMSYSISVTLAASAGLAHAHLQRATPGAAMALAMSAATLALGSQVGMVSPAGAAFGIIVATAAVVGSLSLRLEAMHLAAFGAAVIGLFVLSGQDSAAIWFTPAAAWAGAVFLAIAFVRVPQLGPRGLALAGTGAFGPLGAIVALHASQQGLADPPMAAAAFVTLAAALAGVLAVTALRRGRGLGKLTVTLWTLVLAAFAAVAAAIVLALPPPLAAPAFSLLALGLIALDLRLPDFVWRFFSIPAGLCTVAFAALSGQQLLAETGAWSSWLVIGAAFAAPAIFAAGAAFGAQRSGSKVTAGIFEAIAIGLGVAAAGLIVRLTFSGGAMLLQPIGFVETGAHAATWLLAALLIGARAQSGATGTRIALINTLGLMALTTMAAASVMWMTSYWSSRSGAGPVLLSRDTLGFLIPAVLFWGHWVFWRARAADLQTRLALGAGALLFAAGLTMEATRTTGLPEWAAAMTGAVSFALALGINFAPGVTNLDRPQRRRSHFVENLDRDRRRQQGG